MRLEDCVTRVTSNVYRGREPLSEKEVWDLVDCYQISTVINLEVRRERRGVAWGMIRRFVREYCLPSFPLFPPSPDTVAQCMQILGCESFGKVYVHCRSGVDRTGFIIAKYRISRGETKQSATLDMYRSGMHWWFRWWRWFL